MKVTIQLSEAQIKTACATYINTALAGNVKVSSWDLNISVGIKSRRTRIYTYNPTKKPLRVTVEKEVP